MKCKNWAVNSSTRPTNVLKLVAKQFTLHLEVGNMSRDAIISKRYFQKNNIHTTTTYIFWF